MAGVQTTHALYNKHATQIKLVRDVLEGQDAILNNSNTYFPKISEQTINDYNAMIKRPSFDSFTEQYLDKVTGLLIRKEPIRQIPKKLQPLMDNIDLGNKTDIDFVQDIAFEIMSAGRVGILIDYDNSKLSEGTYSWDTIEQYNRPFAKIYKTESIINWRVENNELVMVVLAEDVDIWISEFEVNTIKQYTVYYLEDNICKRKIYRENQDGVYEALEDIVEITIRGTKISFIPFVVANQNTLEVTPYKPPLYNMANTNITLHRLKIDHYWNLMFHSAPFIVLKTQNVGDDKSPIRIGATAVTEIGINESIEFVEFKGEGAKFLVEEIANCKTTMANLGAEFLMAEGSNKESYEAKLLRDKDSNTTIVNIADVVGRIMAKVLGVFQMYYATNESIKYELDLDFNEDKADAQMLTALGSELAMNHITSKDYYSKLVEWGLTRYETYEDFSDALKENPIPMEFGSQTITAREKDKNIMNSVKSKLGL